ncbi:MAG: hypothetical protein MUE82_13630, partial [Chloroflexi bacterium]|nr:hypothetical protein [Chloroflexota bacterium]
MLLSATEVHAGRAVGWLTVDDFDNAPTVFLTYLAAMIDRIHPLDPSVGAALARGPRMIPTALPRLAGELHRIDRPTLLVFDDVHRLTDRGCLDALESLLDYLPSGIQLAMAGRVAPDLPLARLRARRDLLEIRSHDLALDVAEASALVAAAGHPLAAADARALVDRTEGWAAGIYLATLAEEHGTGLAAGAGRAVSVSGGAGYIAEYLRSELASSMDGADAAFLASTSILDVVEPPVAEAVAGMPDAAGRLERLAGANQLIVRVGGPGPTYRYHNLMREYLAAEVERREPGRAPELHRRASAWYRAAGRSALAVEHALRSGDVDDAAALVAAAALPTFYGGHGDTLARWLAAFDESAFEHRPQLAVIAAWVHLLNGRPADAERMAAIAERSTFDGPPGDGTASFASGRSMLRAVMAGRGPGSVRADAEAALREERRGSPWRANALWLVGAAHVLDGDAAEADAAFAQAVEAASEAGATAMIALAQRGSLAIERSDWRAAEDLARRSYAVLDSARFGDIVPSMYVYALAARVAIHRGDAARARAELVHAQLVRPLTSSAAPWFSMMALIELARAYLATSDPSGA